MAIALPRQPIAVNKFMQSRNARNLQPSKVAKSPLMPQIVESKG